MADDDYFNHWGMIKLKSASSNTFSGFMKQKFSIFTIMQTLSFKCSTDAWKIKRYPVTCEPNWISIFLRQIIDSMNLILQWQYMTNELNNMITPTFFAEARCYSENVFASKVKCHDIIKNVTKDIDIFIRTIFICSYHSESIENL